MLADLDGRGVEGLLCLGDIVGYGADPGPVVEAVAPRVAAAVAGNHDRAAAGLIDLGWFNPYARRAAEWTGEHLTAFQTRYLAGLPLRVEHAGATLVHASPRRPEIWSYVVSEADGAAAFRYFETALCFIGHSHLPAIWTLRPGGPDGKIEYRWGAGRVVLVEGERCLVNVGSVGQPRDGDPWAAYAVWDLEARSVEVRRVAYDVHEARRRIHAAGLPRRLGDRLLQGR